MKMKKGLLMVVLLLALSSIMAAMSYSTAKVTNAMTGTVTNTHAALLGLAPLDGGHDAAKIEDGVLKFDFTYKGAGVQQDSEYIWNKLFVVKNNSENPVNVKINTGDYVLPGVKLYVKFGDGNWQKIDKHTFATAPASINSGYRHDMAVKIEVDKIAGFKNSQIKTFTPNLIVHGEK